MCIGVPTQILAIYHDKQSAVVGTSDNPQVVSLMLLEQEVKIGDYLLIQVGNFAVEKIEKEDAIKAIQLQKALAEGDFKRAAELY